MRRKLATGLVAALVLVALSTAAAGAAATVEATCKKSWLVPNSCSICGALDDQNICTCTINCNDEQ